VIDRLLTGGGLAGRDAGAPRGSVLILFNSLVSHFHIFFVRGRVWRRRAEETGSRSLYLDIEARNRFGPSGGAIGWVHGVLVMESSVVKIGQNRSKWLSAGGREKRGNLDFG
jgi:hypothetical protein